VAIPYPIYGNYRLQFGPDTGTSPEEFVNPGPRAYADDEGGIWLFARHPMMPTEVTLSVWPVGARPIREGALIGYDGEFEVPDYGDEPVEGWVLGEVNVPRDDITLSTRLEPGVWAVLVQVTGQDEADRAYQAYLDDPNYGSIPAPGPIEHWYVDIIDTADEEEEDP
jgi:hypothetical protein